MDGDGDSQATADLVGQSKDNAPYQTGDGYSMTNGMAEYKDQGAENKGDNHPPSSQEAIEYSPKEDLFRHGPYYPANNEEKDKIRGLRW